MTDTADKTETAERNVWIIGASSGIGRALAVALDKRGCRLFLSARSKDKLKGLNRELGGLHGVFPLDVTDHAGFAKTAQKVFDDAGHIHSVIFMAGAYTPMKIFNLDMDAARKIVDVNLMGALNAVDIVMPLLAGQEDGQKQVAFCASVAGYRGLPNAQPYGATKAALNNLAESLRVEYAGRGVDVRVINPGFVRTPLTDKNEFEMPMIIEPGAAATAIADGLEKGAFDINFPKKFTLFLRLLRILPDPVYFWAVKKLL